MSQIQIHTFEVGQLLAPKRGCVVTFMSIFKQYAVVKFFPYVKSTELYIVIAHSASSVTLLESSTGRQLTLIDVYNDRTLLASYTSHTAMINDWEQQNWVQPMSYTILIKYKTAFSIL